MIKDIEKTTNHDIKALEYLIKDKLKDSDFKVGDSENLINPSLWKK